MAELTRKEVVLVLAAAPDVACPRGEHRVRLAGVDLSGLDLRGLNLAHADLAGSNLRGCDLSDARLFEADLSGADLTDAVLCGAYADGATFVAATLVRVDFRQSPRNLFYGTHMLGADFRGADLTDARLEEAALGGARFEEALLAGTILCEARDDGEAEDAMGEAGVLTPETETTVGPSMVLWTAQIARPAAAHPAGPITAAA